MKKKINDKNITDENRQKDILWKEYNGEILARFIESRNKKAIQLCLNAGADVNWNKRQSWNKNQIIKLAVKFMPEIIGDLIKKNVDLYDDNDEFNALHYAIEEGSMKAIKTLIRHGIDINTKGKHDLTALHYAVVKRDINVIKYLLDKGAAVNAKNDNGQTPLLHAARWSWTPARIIKLLIKYGADINCKDIWGRKLIHLLIMTHKPCLIMNLKMSKIDKDINAKDDYGQTPLHFASRWTNRIIFYKWLLAKGSDANIQDNAGMIPLHYAIQYKKNIQILKLLISHGSDIRIKDSAGNTALDYD